MDAMEDEWAYFNDRGRVAWAHTHPRFHYFPSTNLKDPKLLLGDA